MLIFFNSLIDDQLKKPSRASRRSAKYDWTYYQNFEEIYDWMNETAAEYPDIVSLIDIGRSVENRPIIGMKIDYKKKENPVIGVFEGTLHAREWITPVTLTWIVKEFLTSRDEKIRFLAENIVWHVFPITNPDGFIYTFTGVSTSVIGDSIVYITYLKKKIEISILGIKF